MKLNLLFTSTLKIGAILSGCLILGCVHAADVDKLVAVCADCHGKNGASKESDVPIIAGNSTEFLENNLGYFQTKERNCLETEYREGSKKGEKTDMCQIVKDYSEEDIKAIADYFSKNKFVRADQAFDAALAKKGQKIHDKQCETCHSEGGTLSEDEAGIPAGQWMPYLRHTLKEFKTGERPMSRKMKRKLQKVRGNGIEELVNFYGSFK